MKVFQPQVEHYHTAVRDMQKTLQNSVGQPSTPGQEAKALPLSSNGPQTPTVSERTEIHISFKSLTALYTLSIV